MVRFTARFAVFVWFYAWVGLGCWGWLGWFGLVLFLFGLDVSYPPNKGDFAFYKSRLQHLGE